MAGGLGGTLLRSFRPVWLQLCSQKKDRLAAVPQCIFLRNSDQAATAFRFLRHHASRPPLAKIKPGIPAPHDGARDCGGSDYVKRAQYVSFAGKGITSLRSSRTRIVFIPASLKAATWCYLKPISGGYKLMLAIPLMV